MAQCCELQVTFMELYEVGVFSDSLQMMFRMFYNRFVAFLFFLKFFFCPLVAFV